MEIGSRGVLAAIGIFLAAFGCTRKAEVGTEGSSSLRLTPQRIDLGSLKSTENAKANIRIQNVGGSEYRLRTLMLSCGCMSSDFSSRVIGPGETYEFSVRLLKTSLGMGAQSGEISVEPNLETPLRFDLHYKILPSCSLFPDNYLLGPVALDNFWPKFIEFQVDDKADGIPIAGPIRLESPENQSDTFMIYKIVQPEFSKPCKAVTLEVYPRGNVGCFQDFIHLTVPSIDEDFEFSIGVSGTVSRSRDELQLE